MTNFRVWAPLASSVSVCFDEGTSLPMEESKGWWQYDHAVAPDARYQFQIDDGEPMPDPQSRYQPDGVHGWSVTVDDAFDWTDQHWPGVQLRDSVIYELHLGTFSAEGTFDGAIDHLDHLADLGVDLIEVMPVGQFPGARGWGYDGVDLFAAQSSYGGPGAMKRFVDACHGRGLGVVLDVVYNHFGPDGNYLSQFGPYLTEAHHTPWGPAVNYDQDHCDGVRQFVLQNVEMWLRTYHVDALRLDAVHAIVDDTRPHIVAEVVSLARSVGDARSFPASVIAESDQRERVVVTADGWDCDAQWNDEFHHAIHVAVTGEQQGYYAAFDGVPSLVAAVNDNFMTTDVVADVDPRRFVVCSQNHDQVGNRAFGERLSMLTSRDALFAVAALTVLSPSIPMIFQGEEWGALTPFLYFTDHQDPELGRAVTQGRRNEFEWAYETGLEAPDPQSVEAFVQSKLQWEELDEVGHGELFEWYRSLIDLRRSMPMTNARASHDGDVITVRYDTLCVTANLSADTPTFDIPAGEVLLTHGQGPWQVAVVGL